MEETWHIVTTTGEIPANVTALMAVMLSANAKLAPGPGLLVTLLNGVAHLEIADVTMKVVTTTEMV